MTTFGGAAFWRRVGLGAYLLIALGPLLALGLGLGQSLFGGQIDLLTLAVPVGRRGTLFLRTLGLALAVAGSALVVSLLAASLLWRWRSGRARWLRWLVVVPALIPPYVHALAWSPMFGMLGTILREPGGGTALPRDWLTTWWVLLMALAPLATTLALVGLEAVEPRLVEAARLLDDDLKAFRKVVIPLAAPAALVGATLVLLLTLLDYSVPSLFGVSVYALEIFSEFSASGQAARAIGLGLPLLAVAAAAVILSQRPIRDAAVGVRRVGRVPVPALVLPAWLVALQWTALGLLVLAAALPLAGLVVAVGSPASLGASIASGSSELLYSAVVGLVCGLLALPLALAAAGQLQHRGDGERIWWMLVTLPLAVPASLVGIGLIALWNQPALALYGSPAMPVLAGLARFLPIATLIVLAQLRRLDPSLVDAARVLQSGWLQTWREVLLPLLAPGLLAAFSVTFVLTVGELGATLMVVPPGQATVTMRVYSFMHYGAPASVAGLCLTTVIAATLGGAAAAWALESRRGRAR